MQKEEIIVIAQLLTAIKDGLEKLGEAQRKNDKEGFALAKQEILNFQRKIDKLL